MKINPVTVTFSRHELDLIQNTMNQLAKRNSRVGRTAAFILDTIGGAIKDHDRKHAHDRYFGAFWKDNQQLKWRDAQESFNLSSPRKARCTSKPPTPTNSAPAPMALWCSASLTNSRNRALSQNCDDARSSAGGTRRSERDKPMELLTWHSNQK